MLHIFLLYIIVVMNQCCICYQLSNSITNCGHYICLSCVSYLKIDSIEDLDIIFIKGYKCPLCREYIMYFIDCDVK